MPIHTVQKLHLRQEGGEGGRTHNALKVVVVREGRQGPQRECLGEGEGRRQRIVKRLWAGGEKARAKARACVAQVGEAEVSSTGDTLQRSRRARRERCPARVMHSMRARRREANTTNGAAKPNQHPAVAHEAHWPNTQAHIIPP